MLSGLKFKGVHMIFNFIAVLILSLLSINSAQAQGPHNNSTSLESGSGSPRLNQCAEFIEEYISNRCGADNPPANCSSICLNIHAECNAGEIPGGCTQIPPGRAPSNVSPPL